MSQSGASAVRRTVENEEGESQRQEDLRKEQRKLAAEKRKLEQEKKEFYWRKQLEEKKFLQEKRLFEMKWKILEEELQKFAKEKQEMEQEREQYFFRKDSRNATDEVHKKDTCVTLFFTGVGTKSALKKRYKDLIKIFHPDNSDGDTEALQIINKEYDELRKAFEG